jgi:hypothetical protein
MHLGVTCKPNSGWFAIVYAAQMCRSVRLYGFSGWRHVGGDGDVDANATAAGAGAGAGGNRRRGGSSSRGGGGGGRGQARGSDGQGHDGVKYHYFDRAEGVDTVHSFSLTLEALQLLATKYPFLTLHG